MWENYCSIYNIIDIESLLSIVNIFYRIQRERGIDPKAVHLTGLEPTLWRHGNTTIVDLVHLLHKEGFIVELTSNGSTLIELAQSLAEAGVAKIRVSLSSARPERYFLMTGKNYFSRVICGLEAVCRESIEVKINYLLTSETYRDVSELIPFVMKYDVTVKLMKLHWSIVSNQLSCVDPLQVVNDLIIPLSTGQLLEYFDSPIRKVIRFPLKTRGIVEIKLPVKGSLETYFPFCRACKYLRNCDEATSLVPPGVWLTPELDLIFCPFRRGPKIALKALMDKKPPCGMIREYIAKELNDTVFYGQMPGFPLPIRAIITSQCNMNCVFCHAEGYKKV